MFELQITRYIFIAVLAYVIDFGGFIALINLGLTPVYANILVKIAAALFGFFAHRRFTYQITHNKDVGHHASRYFGIALFYTPASTLVLYWLMKVIVSVALAKFIADVILFVITYYITSKFVFFKS